MAKFVGLVLLLLRRHWNPENEELGRVYRGLVLIPAGPGIVRRIGTFEGLGEYDIEDVVEQEITIV